MAADRPLTIRDYIEPRPAAVAGTRIARPAGKGVSSFKELLAKEALPKKDGPNSGMRLSDYFARTVIFPQPSRLGAARGRSGATTAPAADASTATGGRTARQLQAQAAGEQSRLRPRAAGRSPQPGTQRVQLPASESDVIEQAIRQAASRYNLSPDLIRSVIRAESAFQPQAVSPAGAQGLMQLMPETAKELGVTDPFDVRQNIDGGVRYLRQMLDRFDGDLKMALSAYNAGPGAVEKYEGQVPYAETRHYVKRVLRFAGLKA